MTKARADLLVKDIIDIDQYFDAIASWDAFVARYTQKVEELELRSDEKAVAARNALKAFKLKLDEYKTHHNHSALSDLNKFLDIAICLTSGETSAFLNEDIVENKSVIKLIPIVKSFISDANRLKNVGEEYDRYLKRLEYLKQLKLEELNDEEVEELGGLEKRLGQDEDARPDWQRAMYVAQRKYVLSVDERNRLVGKAIKAIKHHVKNKANQVSDQIIVKEGEAADAAAATKARAKSFIQACVAANFRVAELTIQFFAFFQGQNEHRSHFDKTIWDEQKKAIDKSLSMHLFQLVASFATDTLDLSHEKPSAPSRAEVRLSSRQSRMSTVQEEDVQLLPIIENVRKSLTLLSPDLIASDAPALDSDVAEAVSNENRRPFVRSLVHTRSVAAIGSIWNQPERTVAPSASVASSSNGNVADQHPSNDQSSDKPSSFKKFRRKASSIFGPSSGSEPKPSDAKPPKKG